MLCNDHNDYVLIELCRENDWDAGPQVKISNVICGVWHRSQKSLVRAD